MTTWWLSANVGGPVERPLDAVRVLLVADVLGRVVEHLLGGRYVIVVPDHGRIADPRQAAWVKALGIGDLTTRADRPDALGFLDGPRIALEPAGAVPADPAADVRPCRLRIGAVSMPGHAASALADLRDHEPLAIRLALLRFPFADQAVLSSARLHRAEETLTRWRFKIAGWADMPAASPMTQLVDPIREALVADLDTGAVLTLLHRFEADLQVASGTKFEAFDYADRVLALDMKHWVHRLPR